MDGIPQPPPGGYPVYPFGQYVPKNKTEARMLARTRDQIKRKEERERKKKGYPRYE